MKNTIKLSIAASLLLVNAINAEEVLGPIIVTSASKTEQSIKDVTSNVQIITGEELEEKKITTVLEALKYNGISISQSGGLGQNSSFYMDGMNSGNTLVLIDGISYNDPTTTEGQAQLEHLMVNDIERIEIIHGAQSGIYGPNAVAGVINIITKEATKSFKAHATVEYGSFNTKKIKTSVSQRFEKFSYYLGVNYLDSDGFSASLPTGASLDDYEDDGYTNRTINGKFGYQISENDKLTFNITDIKADVEYDDYFGGPNLL